MRLITLFLLFCSQSLLAQNYSPEDATGAVEFRVRNFGLEVNGSLKGLTGNIQFNPVNLAASSFMVKVDASTINTNNSMRDKHLRGNDYFDVIRFPTITMKSERIEKSATPGYYIFTGRLAMKGVEKEISFPFTTAQETGGIRFSGTLTIKRRDFGIGGRSTISNEVRIKLHVLGKNTTPLNY